MGEMILPQRDGKILILDTDMKHFYEMRYSTITKEPDMTAKQILELIEKVDPASPTQMSELDVMVWCYLNKQTLKSFETWGAGGEYETEDGVYSFEIGELDWVSFSRSRDALKEIRPDGWWLECCKIENGTYMAELHDDRGRSGDEEGQTVRAWYYKTEELAELAAVIMAIQHERER